MSCFLIGGYHCGLQVDLPYERAIVYAIKPISEMEVVLMREPVNSTEGIHYEIYRKAKHRDGRIVYIYEQIYGKITNLKRRKP